MSNAQKLGKPAAVTVTLLAVGSAITATAMRNRQSQVTPTAGRYFCRVGRRTGRPLGPRASKPDRRAEIVCRWHGDQWAIAKCVRYLSAVPRTDPQPRADRPGDVPAPYVPSGKPVSSAGVAQPVQSAGGHRIAGSSHLFGRGFSRAGSCSAHRSAQVASSRGISACDVGDQLRARNADLGTFSSRSGSAGKQPNGRQQSAGRFNSVSSQLRFEFDRFGAALGELFEPAGCAEPADHRHVDPAAADARVFERDRCRKRVSARLRDSRSEVGRQRPGLRHRRRSPRSVFGGPGESNYVLFTGLPAGSFPVVVDGQTYNYNGVLIPFSLPNPNTPASSLSANSSLSNQLTQGSKKGLTTIAPNTVVAPPSQKGKTTRKPASPVKPTADRAPMARAGEWIPVTLLGITQKEPRPQRYSAK